MKKIILFLLLIPIIFSLVQDTSALTFGPFLSTPQLPDIYSTTGVPYTQISSWSIIDVVVYSEIYPTYQLYDMFSCAILDSTTSTGYLFSQWFTNASISSASVFESNFHWVSFSFWIDPSNPFTDWWVPIYTVFQDYLWSWWEIVSWLPLTVFPRIPNSAWLVPDSAVFCVQTHYTLNISDWWTPGVYVSGQDWSYYNFSDGGYYYDTLTYTATPYWILLYGNPSPSISWLLYTSDAAWYYSIVSDATRYFYYGINSRPPDFVTDFMNNIGGTGSVATSLPDWLSSTYSIIDEPIGPVDPVPLPGEVIKWDYIENIDNPVPEVPTCSFSFDGDGFSCLASWIGYAGDLVIYWLKFVVNTLIDIANWVIGIFDRIVRAIVDFPSTVYDFFVGLIPDISYSGVSSTCLSENWTGSTVGFGSGITSISYFQKVVNLFTLMVPIPPQEWGDICTFSHGQVEIEYRRASTNSGQIFWATRSNTPDTFNGFDQIFILIFAFCTAAYVYLLNHKPHA